MSTLTFPEHAKKREEVETKMVSFLKEKWEVVVLI
jgi:hypothetical protein